MKICQNCEHDSVTHYKDHGVWRCRWETGKMGQREYCPCDNYHPQIIEWLEDDPVYQQLRSLSPSQ